MKKRFLFSTAILLMQFWAFSQNKLPLNRKFLDADSVIIISYDHKVGGDDRKTLVNGKLNLLMLKEYKRLDVLSTKRLIQIITQPFKDSIIEEIACWKPRHTIAIFKKSRISFITICFECEHIITSGDLHIPENTFDQSTWTKLRLFFKTLGLKYEIRRPL